VALLSNNFNKINTRSRVNLLSGLHDVTSFLAALRANKPIEVIQTIQPLKYQVRNHVVGWLLYVDATVEPCH